MWIAIVVAGGCKDVGERKAPPADPPAPRVFRYEFTVEPTNADTDYFVAGNQMEWGFHRRGFCNGKKGTGEPFLPKYANKSFVADVDDITVDLAIHRGSGDVIATGCAHAKLFGTRRTVIEVPVSVGP